MKKLFNAFEPVNLEQWLEKITTDLKGKPIDILTSNPEADLETVAYHHQETVANYPENSPGRNLKRPSNDWNIRQAFSAQSDQETNKKVLSALNEGVNHIGLHVNSTTDFGTLSKDILFEHIGSDIQFHDLDSAVNTVVGKETDLNFDVIAHNAENGSNALSLEDFHTFYSQRTGSKRCWVNGYTYGKSGASSIQELAFTCAHVNEYIHFLSSKGHSLQEINENLILSLSINENYFVNIAKLRTIRELIALVFQAYDSSYTVSPVKIYAQTNIRHFAKNDKNNNVLRETTQAMSAVIGGANVLTVDFPEFGDKTEQNRFERLAKNIQLILKEESYLDKVVDPSAGSYYIESLTDQLLTKSWSLFQEIERNGGLIENLKNNQIQEKITTNRDALITALNDGSRTFLGVNKYPNGMEDWTSVTSAAEKANETTAYQPLHPFYLEAYYQKEEAKS